ncbi:MAG TPA: DUF397 domain-containing protein [Pseudonocardiaceae bacterium]|nr:DUF397 domain-containing protein [Pseudonocardiaceae bacterium]
MSATPADRDGWFKSSYSSGSASCVEVKFADGATLVRDSKDRTIGQPTIGIRASAWNSFMNAVIRPEFQAER